MRRVLLLACGLAAACRIGLDEEPVFRDAALFDAAPDAPSAACVSATGYSDLTNIKNEIFLKNCHGTACHRIDTTDNDVDLFLDQDPHAELVNVASDLDPRHKLVVPGEPNQSYLLYMVRAIAPTDMGPPASATPPNDNEFMPSTTQRLCFEKQEAIKRWILEGALDN